MKPTHAFQNLRGAHFAGILLARLAVRHCRLRRSHAGAVPVVYEHWISGSVMRSGM